MGSRKNALILDFTLLVSLGYGMIQPILPFLITELGANGRDMGLLASVYAAMQLVCAPFWGTLSDRIGRRPVLLIGVLGYAITMFIFGLSTRFWMLLVARTFSGVLSSGTLPTALAYLSDNLPEKERGGAMGQLGAAVGLGIVLGPLLGGLLSTSSLALPFFVGAGPGAAGPAAGVPSPARVTFCAAGCQSGSKRQLLALDRTQETAAQPGRNTIVTHLHHEFWLNRFPGHQRPVCIG
jgi:multidrug resistance protein